MVTVSIPRTPQIESNKLPGLIAKPAGFESKEPFQYLAKSMNISKTSLNSRANFWQFKQANQTPPAQKFVLPKMMQQMQQTPQIKASTVGQTPQPLVININ